MIAIETRYVGPTDTRGSRVQVRRMDGPAPSGIKADKPTTIYVHWPDEYSGEDAHFVGVKEFCRRYDWHGKLVCGGTDCGFVWVFVPKDTPVTDETAYPRVWEV